MVVQGTVQGGTSPYKAVHDGKRNCTRQYKTVCTGMYWYVLIPGLRFNPVMLPCGWIRCCNSARPIALYLKTSASNDSNASSSMF